MLALRGTSVVASLPRGIRDLRRASSPPLGSSCPRNGRRFKFRETRGGSPESARASHPRPDRRVPLPQNTHIEGAREHDGHAFTGDFLAGPEKLAHGLIVSLDEALVRAPGARLALGTNRDTAVIAATAHLFAARTTVNRPFGFVRVAIPYPLFTSPAPSSCG